MNQIRNIFRRFRTEIKPVPVGTYPYQTPPDAEQQYRLHLRVEPNGTGMLIVNASTVLHLNETATEYAYYFINRVPKDEVVKTVTGRYKVDAQQAAADYQNLLDRIETLILMPDLDPVSFLDFERTDPYAPHFSAPLRLDCALTYRTRSGMDPRIAPTGNVRRELTTEEWQSILTKAWNAGIPHVIFTGGEPTMRSDIPDLIRHAEQLGQVTGLMTDGLRLSDTHYLQQLLQSGLDHLMLVFFPEEDEAWEALRDVLAEDLSVTVHLTLTPQNSVRFDDLLDRICDMGARTVSLSATDPSLAPQLQAARDGLATRGISLVWDVPVPYSSLHPVALEVGETAPEGAGKAWLYVEPDGDVLPAQGVDKVLGNLLQDPWEQIWKTAETQA